MASTLTVDNIVGATTSNTVHLPGHVIQVVSAEMLDTASYNGAMPSWQDTGFSCTITPKFNTSKILVTVDAALGNTTAVFNYMRVVRNIGGGSYSMISEADTPGSRNAIHGMAPYGANEGVMGLQSFTHLDNPATTSAVIYKIQGSCSGGNYSYIGQSNRDTDGAAYDPRMSSRIVLQEIAQ